jgi:hypothetical protein
MTMNHLFPARITISTCWQSVMMMLTVLLLTGCGSQSVGPPSTTQQTEEADETPSPSGPCDRDHREEAIAAARTALRKRVGHVSRQELQAEFMVINVSPQAPGQPAEAPLPGWLISFMAWGPVNDEDSGPNAAGSLAPLAPPQPTSLNGRHEVTLAAQQLSPGMAPAAGEATPSQASPNQVLTLPDGMQQPNSRSADGVVAAGGVAGSASRRYLIFVHVDGSVTFM